MMRSLYAGVSGLKNHQLWLDVIGNNIANVNTAGFKPSDVNFQDVLSQTIQGEVRPTSTSGGINYKQVGLGVSLGSIRTIFNQGAIENTGNVTDLAIQGEGFFVLSDGSSKYYTRSGAFGVDANGTLVDSITGYRVLGLNGNIIVSQGAYNGAAMTATTYFKGNLNAGSDTGTTYQSSFNIYDSQGIAHSLIMDLQKTANNTWSITGFTESDPSMSVTGGTYSTTPLVFDANGNLLSGNSSTVILSFTNGASTPQTIMLDFGTSANTSPVTQYGDASTVTISSQSGYSSGVLQSFNISPDGKVNGIYSNGQTKVIDTIRMAVFPNSQGLLKTGGNLFRETGNSGLANEGAPNSGGRGTLVPGALEMSSVDLAQEFTKMIVAQRGFQANSRIITTSDEVLHDLVSIKR